MFALEVEFKDGMSPSEFLLVRRPNALIGASDFADVVIDDMRKLDYQLRVVKGLGRQFTCQPIGLADNSKVADFLHGIYESEAEIDLGDISLHITVLDSDLFLKESEPPDRAGVRVLRQACSLNSPVFPALVVMGSPPVVFSFFADQQVVVGRSKKCNLRLDAPEISSEHARFGFESGSFWVEDLGSTNGTFVDGHQVSGKQSFNSGTNVVLGRGVTVVSVTSVDQLRQLTAVPGQVQQEAVDRYPVLVSKSELVRPARFVMQLGSALNIGRDPSSDIWLGAPHVSRKHCGVALSKSGVVTITDFSTNGTAYDGGMLKRGDTIETAAQPRVLDFGGDITLAVCFDLEQEETFMKSNGSRYTFTKGVDASGPTRVSGSYVVQNAATKFESMSAVSKLPRGAQIIKSFSSKTKIWLGLIAVGLIIILWFLMELLKPHGF